MSDERAADEAGAATRRALLVGAGAAGATVVLAACGTDDGSNPYLAPPDASDQTTTPAAEPTGAASEAPEEESDEGGEDGLVATDEVEVGGGVILADQDIVITQPTQGEWRGFSATCTHQGCDVSTVSDGTINCNCHGSQFSIEDGSVVAAAFGGDPSSQNPLPPVEVEVSDGWVVRA
jgi:Rieske Fe-S protein